MYEDVLRKLEENIDFRERKNRMQVIATLLIEKYHINAEPSRVKAIIEDANSMDRYWRLILADRKDLQGKDYDTKQKVEQEKQIELGYEANHFQDIKTLKML